MRESEAIIERVWQLSPELQRLELTVDVSLTQLQPGQSLLALANDAWNPYLREHWIPTHSQADLLVIERPTSIHYSPGQVVSVIGPIGNPIPWLGSGSQRLLLIAHDTPPTPLLMLAQQAAEQTAEVALVLLGNATDYPFTGIPPAIEVINGNDSTWPDMDITLNWADQMFCVVNADFWQEYLAGLFQLAQETKGHVPANFLYGVSTLPIPCGTGACAACMVRCKTAPKLACTEGPALDLTEVHLL